MADDNTNQSGGNAQQVGESAPHMRYEAQLQTSLIRRSEIQTWEGSQADIIALFNSAAAGSLWTDVQFLTNGGSQPGEGDEWGLAHVSAVSAPRRQGGIWTLQLTVTQLRYVMIWTLDYVEVAKPIRTWLAGTTDAPDLAQLKKWELAGEKEDWENYDNYQTVDGVALEGNTLTLAKMIREKGIESYTIHAPVATCQLNYATFPAGVGAFLDKQFSALPTIETGWKDLCAGDPDAVRQELDGLCPDGGAWLGAGDRVNPNADGSYTRTVQFTAANAIDENLYPSGGSGTGGGTEGGGT